MLFSKKYSLLLLLLGGIYSLTPAAGMDSKENDGFVNLAGKSEKPVLACPVNGAAGYPSKPRLEWDAVPGTKVYNIEISKNSSFAAGDTKSYKANTFCLDIPADLDVNSTYYWRVKGAGEWSDVWSFSTTSSGVSGTGVPMPFYPVLNEKVKDAKTPLYWYVYESAKGITFYEIDIKEGDSNFNKGKVKHLISSEMNKKTDGLSAGAVYFWRVRAYNGSMNLYSEWSDTESFKLN
jgi:hypothetical protein